MLGETTGCKCVPWIVRRSPEQMIGFRSDRQRATSQFEGGYTRRATVAESQSAPVNWTVRRLLSSAPAAIASTMSQTSPHPTLYAL